MDIDPLDLETPEGAFCAEHPEQPAEYTCPRCKRPVCSSCFNGYLFHCYSCVQRDPLEAMVPLPYEITSLSFFRRITSTLKTAFYPKQTAACFAKCQPLLAIQFLLISTLPLSLLSGVIPHTQTLVFGPGWVLKKVGQPGSMEIALDIARAMLVQLVFDTVFLLAILLPFVSLARAYGRAGCARSASGVILYRFWLIPAAMMVSYVAFFLLPTVEIGLGVQFIISIGALYFFVTAMWWTVRITCGIGPLWSVAVLGVPWILTMVVIALLTILVAFMFGVPHPETLEHSL